MVLIGSSRTLIVNQCKIGYFLSELFQYKPFAPECRARVKIDRFIWLAFKCREEFSNFLRPNQMNMATSPRALCRTVLRSAARAKHVGVGPAVSPAEEWMPQSGTVPGLLLRRLALVLLMLSAERGRQVEGWGRLTALLRLVRQQLEQRLAGDTGLGGGGLWRRQLRGRLGSLRERDTRPQGELVRGGERRCEIIRLQ